MTEDTRVYLKAVVSVVDVDRIYREFLHDLSSDAETEDGDVINLIIDQIEFCNLMILNKTDLLSEEQLDEVKTGLRGLQQKAEMISCVQGNVDLDVILNREDFDFEEVEAYSAVQQALNNCEHDDAKACVDEYGISSFVFEERKPFNRNAFNKLVEEYPQELIRSKGYLWFSDDWEHVQLFEQAGRNASITELSAWVSAWPKEELDMVVRDYPDIMDDWDENYGDRCNQLVFIGKGFEKADIVKRLYECIDNK
jgi:G3E family GTPase